MSEQIQCGHYRIVGPGHWQEGPLVDGQRVEVAEHEYVEYITALTPLVLEQNGLPVLVFTEPGHLRLDPFSLAMTFDVRQAPSR